MEKISIKVPEGYEAVVLNGTIEIRKKETNWWLPKTWEELCERIPRYKVSADDQIVKALTALNKLIELRDYYNQNWKPDWAHTRDVKYCICFDAYNLRVFSLRLCQHPLAFKTQKLAKQFLQNFRDLIEEAKPVL